MTDQQRLVVFVLLVATSAMMWAMLFWDRVMAFVTFHAVTCACDECAAAKQGSN